MPGNRKNQSAVVRLGPALKALLICLFIGGSGVGYVWQQNELLELGRQKVERESRLNTLRAQNSQLARQLAELQSPRSLEARVKELHLGLTMAQPAQTVRLVDAPPTQSVEPAPARNSTGQRYAKRQSAASPTP